jgi:hypothetical protein
MIGDVWVTVNPDASRFRATAKIALDKAVAGLSVNVRVNADDKTLGLQARRAATKAQKEAGSVDIAAKLHSENLKAGMLAVTTQIQSLNKQSVKINADMNDRKFRVEALALEAQVRALSSRSIRIKTFSDLAKVRADAARLSLSMDDLRLKATRAAEALRKKEQEAADAASKLGNSQKKTAGDIGLAQLAFMRLTREAENYSKEIDKLNAAPSHFSTKDILPGNHAGELTALNKALAVTKQEIQDIHDKGGITKPDDVARVTALTRRMGELNKNIVNNGIVVKNTNVMWRGWVNALISLTQRQIPLFGGAFKGVLPHILAFTNGIHLMIDAAIEIAAVWVPAAVAVAVFGAAAAKAALQVAGNVKNMGIATQATGQQFAVMGKIGSGALSMLAKPYVFQAFGLGLIAMQKNSGQTATVVTMMGKTIDKWAAEATSAFLGSSGKMALVGSRDFGQIGESFHALGRVFNTFLKSVPGYAEILLNFGTSFLQVFANVVHALQPVLKGFLAFHGAFLYIGVAVTLFKFLVGQALKPLIQIKDLLKGVSKNAADSVTPWQQASKAIKTAGQEMQGGFSTGAKSVKAALNDLPAGASNTSKAFTAMKATGSAALSGLGSAAKNAGSAVKNGLFKILDNLGVNPWVAGIAVVGVGLYLLVKHFMDAKNAAQQFGDAASKAISSSTVRTFSGVIITQLNAANAAYKQAGTQVVKYRQQSEAALSKPLNRASNITGPLVEANQKLEHATGLLKSYGAVIADLQGKQQLFTQRIGSLGKQLGGTGSAMELVEKSGVSMDDFLSKDTKTWLQAQLQVEATARGYTAMTAGVGGLNTALNALNIQDSQQMKSATDLEGAYSGFLTIITGGTQNLGVFAQGMTTLQQNLGLTAKQASFGNITLGKLKGTLDANHTSLDGTSAASMTAAQAFATQVTNAGTLYNSLLSLATVSGNSANSQHELAKAGKDMVAQLLPIASTSKTATTQVYALAQIAGYTGNNSLKGLRSWLGKTTGSMTDMKTQTDLLTQSAGSLAGDAKTLADNLSQNLNAAMSQSIINAYGGANAMTAAAKAVLAFQQNAQPDNFKKMQAALKPVADMMMTVSGNTTDARNAFIAWAVRLGVGRTEADKMFDSLEHLNKATTSSGRAAQVSLSHFDKLAGGLGIGTKKAGELWSKLAKENLTFVGSKAKASHDKFIAWASQVGISTKQANILWSEIAKENIGAWLTSKIGISQTAFQNITHKIGLTIAQTQGLWAKINQQKFDFLKGKADDNRVSFEKLTRQYGLSTSQADALWRKMKEQQLDSVGRKALTSAGAMNTLANGIANGTIALQDLGTVWQGMQKVLGGPAVTVVSTLPGHKKFTLSQGGVNSPHASGGQVPGYAPGSDTVAARLSPGEFVVNPTAAKAFGYDRLHAINQTKPGSHVRSGAGQMLATGGQIVGEAIKFNGHPYTWGGSPPGRFDCSSFVNMILDSLHVAVPGGWHIGNGHGPTTTTWLASGYPRIPFNQMQPGDIFDTGSHMGFVTGAGGSGFAARSTASGTGPQTVPSSTILRVSNGVGAVPGLIPGAGLSTVSPFTTAQDKQIKAALASTQATETAYKISGGGLGAPVMKAVGTSVERAATTIHGKIQTAYNAKLAAAAAAGAGFGGQAVSVSAGSNFGNLVTIAKYFQSIGYGAAAGAGIAGNVFRESGGNPESSGTGGNGLIGWTPARAGIVTGNASRDLSVQLPMIQQYNLGIGSSAIAHLNSEKNPWNAALYYMNEFEKPKGSVPGSDTATGFSTSAGVIRASMAQQVYAAMGGANATALANTPVGNTGPKQFGGHHLAIGGKVPGFAPGSDTVPAMLSPGEFVINPVAAKAIGYDNLHVMNTQKFAAGGKVKKLTDLQKFESSVAQMTPSGRLTKLNSLIGLSNTEHNHLSQFKPHSASWNSLEHLISLHKQEIAFLEKTGTHLPAPARPVAAKAKPKVYPPGPVGAFERKIDGISALIRSLQAKMTRDQAAFNAAAFVDDENRIGSLTDARSQQQAALAAFQARQPAARKAAAKASAASARAGRFSAAVSAVRLISSLKTPQQKAAYYASPLLGMLADDLLSHSTKPYSIHGVSSSAISSLALSANPDMLDAIYSGNWQGIASLLGGSGKSQFSVFKALANSRGRKFGSGGLISEKVLGVGTSTHLPYVFGEKGVEKVSRVSGGQDNSAMMTSVQAERLIAAVENNTRAVSVADQNNRSALTGVGRGVFRG